MDSVGACVNALTTEISKKKTQEGASQRERKCGLTEADDSRPSESPLLSALSRSSVLTGQGRFPANDANERLGHSERTQRVFVGL